MTILRAQALQLPLRDESVDLVITSPPYFALRSYRDGGEHYAGQIGSEPTPAEFLEALWVATREMVRVLKPSGSIFVNLGDKYNSGGGHTKQGESSQRQGRASADDWVGRPTKTLRSIPPKSLMGLPWRYALGCIDRLGLILRAEIIWSKPNGLPESVADRVRRSHENWFHFVKTGRYYSAVDEIREAHTAEPKTRGSAKYGDGGGDGFTAATGWTDLPSFHNPLGKLPGSVWTIPSEPLIVPNEVQAHYNLPDHFAAFPQEWPRRLILGWSPPSICTRCGDGRRPVVDVDYSPAAARGGDGTINRNRPIVSDAARPNGEGVGAINGLVLDRHTTIVGYACACTPYTDHPERRRGDFNGNSADPAADWTANSSERNRLYREGITAGPSITREYHLTGWTPAPTRPAVVLDPFGGTGTVAMVARALGRVGLNFDLSSDYCRLASWRIHYSGHAAKSEERTWGERQGVMF